MTAMMSCATCGHSIAETAQTCPNCGATTGSRKNALVALILCFFFGWLGFHNFYLGRVFRGIVQLFIFAIGWIPLIGWALFIPLVIWVALEFIMILFGNTSDGDGKIVSL